MMVSGVSGESAIIGIVRADECQKSAVGSKDRRNAFCEDLSWRLVHQDFSWPLVKRPGDGAEPGLAEGREVAAVREVLAQ